ncbi:hypothetical protein C8J57DRAFT_1527857 [Mycena rebaudengoi]|nr:hypothetical protein C8J57DRAFT_1527857 [Mycena rebaudengoi]
MTAYRRLRPLTHQLRHYSAGHCTPTAPSHINCATTPLLITALLARHLNSGPRFLPPNAASSHPAQLTLTAVYPTTLPNATCYRSPSGPPQSYLACVFNPPIGHHCRTLMRDVASSLSTALLETLRQPAVFVDQNPSLPALLLRIVQIRSASSCSPHQYALNYPHSLLLYRSLLYAQNSALCALFTLARRSALFLCSWLGHTPNPPSDTLGRVPSSQGSVNRILPPLSFTVGFVQKAREEYKREERAILGGYRGVQRQFYPVYSKIASETTGTHTRDCPEPPSRAAERCAMRTRLFLRHFVLLRGFPTPAASRACVRACSCVLALVPSSLRRIAVLILALPAITPSLLFCAATDRPTLHGVRLFWHTDAHPTTHPPLAYPAAFYFNLPET